MAKTSLELPDYKELCEVCWLGPKGDCGICESISKVMAEHIGRRVKSFRERIAALEAKVVGGQKGEGG